MMGALKGTALEGMKCLTIDMTDMNDLHLCMLEHGHDGKCRCVCGFEWGIELKESGWYDGKYKYRRSIHVSEKDWDYPLSELPHEINMKDIVITRLDGRTKIAIDIFERHIKLLEKPEPYGVIYICYNKEGIE